MALEAELTGMAFGTFLHRCFEVLGENDDFSNTISAIAGVEISESDVSGIVNCVASFESWMSENFSETAIYRELPLLGMDKNGAVVSGTDDLVLVTDVGVWIIDHKSDQIQNAELAFAQYRPQLACYSNLLQSMGYQVLGFGVNSIRRGEVSFPLPLANILDGIITSSVNVTHGKAARFVCQHEIVELIVQPYDCVERNYAVWYSAV